MKKVAISYSYTSIYGFDSDVDIVNENDVEHHIETLCEELAGFIVQDVRDVYWYE